MKNLLSYIIESLNAKCDLVIDGKRMKTSALSTIAKNDKSQFACISVNNFLKTLKGKNANVTGDLASDGSSGNLKVEYMNKSMTIEWDNSSVVINGRQENIDMNAEQHNGDLPNYGWLTRIWLKYGD